MIFNDTIVFLAADRRHPLRRWHGRTIHRLEHALTVARRSAFAPSWSRRGPVITAAARRLTGLKASWPGSLSAGDRFRVVLSPG